MPRIVTARDIMESNAEAGSDISGIVDSAISRFPYKEYRMARDEKDSALLVTMPDGHTLRMLPKTLEYYSDVSGGSDAQKENYEGALSDIDAAMKSGDIQKMSAKLKEIVRQMSQVEFKPEKYSFVAYVLSSEKDIDAVRRLYAAYADNGADVSSEISKAYGEALSYCLSYYKFLIGLLAVIG